MFRWMSIVAGLRDFVYPPVCLTCDNLIPDGTGRICAACRNSFRRAGPADTACNEFAARLAAEGLIDAFHAAYLFEKRGKLQDVIHCLKYSGMKSLGVGLGSELGRELVRLPEFSGADFIVPVPLHRHKRRERGYNQSDFICTGISSCLPARVLPSLLIRTRNTPSQTRLDIAGRRANVSGAFALNPSCRISLDGSVCILVDDVMTTGATITACAEVLRKAGAAKVLATSIALAM